MQFVSAVRIYHHHHLDYHYIIKSVLLHVMWNYTKLIIQSNVHNTLNNCHVLADHFAVECNVLSFYHNVVTSEMILSHI